MSYRYVLVLLATLGALLAPPSAYTESFHCGAHLIYEGMPITQIRERCGEPRSIERTTEPILARRANGTTYQVGVAAKEFWTYDREPGQFPARMTIEDGIAVKIELLARR